MSTSCIHKNTAHCTEYMPCIPILVPDKVKVAKFLAISELMELIRVNTSDYDVRK